MEDEGAGVGAAQFNIGIPYGSRAEKREHVTGGNVLPPRIRCRAACALETEYGVGCRPHRDDAHPLVVGMQRERPVEVPFNHHVGVVGRRFTHPCQDGNGVARSPSRVEDRADCGWPTEGRADEILNRRSRMRWCGYGVLGNEMRCASRFDHVHGGEGPRLTGAVVEHDIWRNGATPREQVRFDSEC